MNRFKFFDFFHLGVSQARCFRAFAVGLVQARCLRAFAVGLVQARCLRAFAVGLVQARCFRAFAVGLVQARCLHAFAVGLVQARCFRAFAWAGVFRGTLRFRASAAHALPAHRPSLRFGRTPSTSRGTGACGVATHSPYWSATLSSPSIISALFAIILLTATSCVRVEVPTDVLDREAMAALLADIHLLEGRRVGDRVLYTDDAYMKDYYARIFQKHGITEEQYRRSHYFYTQYPDLFSKVYDRTIEILQQRQIESENIPTPAAQSASEDNF